MKKDWQQQAQLQEQQPMRSLSQDLSTTITITIIISIIPVVHTRMDIIITGVTDIVVDIITTMMDIDTIMGIDTRQEEDLTDTSLAIDATAKPYLLHSII